MPGRTARRSSVSTRSGVPAAAVLKAARAGTIPTHSADLGGLTLVDSADVDALAAEQRG
jgi:hypothetical protein